MTDPIVCEHSQLARQCPLCERDEEVARLRGLLRWVYRNHGAAWALVCDEEIEIEEIAREGES